MGTPSFLTRAVSFKSAAACLLLLTIVVYLPSLGNGFVWDDGSNIAQKITLPGLGGLVRIWIDPHANQQYYPLTHTALWFDYTMWRLWALPYHVNNILLHALSAILIFAILRRLSVPGAWLAAAVFAVHPVNVESVAWCTERKNTLAGVFAFGSVLTYLIYAGIGKAGSDECKSVPRMYWHSLVLFVCALLSKTAIVTLPLALLAIVWWKRDRLQGGDLWPLLPFLGASAAMGTVTTWIEASIGASGEVWNLTFLEKTLVGGRALWFYAAKVFWPQGIMFIYPRWIVDARDVWQYAYPVGLVIVIAALWLLRRRLGKGPLAAALYFILLVFPALGFLNIYFQRFSYVQDHFQYFGMIGLAALGAYIVGNGVRSASGLRTSVWLAGGGLLLVMLGVISWNAQAKYYNEETLWRNTVASNPSAGIAYINLGILLMDNGNMEEAGQLLGRATRLAPRDYEAWSNYGRWVAVSGKPAEAIPYYEKALELKPRGVAALNNLAAAAVDVGRLDLAERSARRALRYNDRAATAHAILGEVLLRKNNIDEAVLHLKAAARLDPKNTDYEIKLDEALSMQ